MTVDYTESGRRREIVPAIPFLYLKQKSGMHYVIDADNLFMAWGARRFKTSDFTLKCADAPDRPAWIRINYTGYYEITLETSLKLTEGSADYVIMSLIYTKNWNPDSTVATWHYVDGASAYSTVTTDIGSNLTMHHVLYIEKGTWIAGWTDVGGESDPFKIESEADSDRCIIKWIPMRGWNNNSAGKINYRGGILR